jgi:hypothetical protein
MLDDHFFRSLSENSIHELWLSDIESHEDDAWENLCQLLYYNNSLMRFSLCLSADRHTLNPGILNIRESRILRMLSVLENHSVLQNFELSLGNISKAITKGVAQLIDRNKNIQVIGFPDNKLEGWNLDLLFPAIDRSKNIQSIDFRKNRLQYNETQILKKISNGRKMNRFNVSYNNLGNSAIQLLLMPASSDFEKNSIDYLDLSYNNINKNGIQKLYKKLNNFKSSLIPSTSKLFLNGNPISCMGAKTLAKIFKSGFEFDEIYLKNTDLNDRAVINLCSSIIKTSENQSPISVRVLNLEGASILIDGAAAIAKIIRGSNSLEKITLSYDRINASNKLIIAEALRYNTLIKEFHFTYDGSNPNHYSENRASCNLGVNILDIFIENKTLEHIDFCGIWSGKDAKIYSDIMLENLYFLKNILRNLDNIRIRPEGIENEKIKYISGLNACNTLINRIDNYFKFDQYRGPSNVQDSSKDSLLLLQEEFFNLKKEFHRLSVETSLYEEILKKIVPEVKYLFEKNTTGMVNEFIGKRSHNILLTNFMLEKSKQRTFLEEKKDDDIMLVENVNHPRLKPEACKATCKPS